MEKQNETPEQWLDGLKWDIPQQPNQGDKTSDMTEKQKGLLDDLIK